VIVRSEPPKASIRGVSAAPGIAVGRAHVLDRGRFATPRRRIDADTTEYERGRLEQAIETSRTELCAIRDQLDVEGAATFRMLLDAHVAMHDDVMLIESAVTLMKAELINAEWALERVIASIKEQFESVSDGYFRERAGDVEQVGERILRQLVGRVSLLPMVQGGSVLVATDLSPADAVQLSQSRPAAIVLELGSPTSHTAILARAMEIPCIVGVANATRRIAHGDTVVVDALRGDVILDADDAMLARVEERSRRYRHFTGKLRERRSLVPELQDGTVVELSANVELASEVLIANLDGVAGIGLFRTEFLYLGRANPPTEDEQVDVYADVLRAAEQRPVVFRVFDFGGDKLPFASPVARPSNPALALRGLRFALTRLDLLMTQLRAILRASVHGKARIMFPMVATIPDLRRAKQCVLDVQAQLKADGVPFAEVPIGTMIEVPSAVMLADHLAKEADFFSVGTNDLVQYVLALDRSDPKLFSRARLYDPAVLRTLAHVAKAAEHASVPFAMCGDMAADPIALPLVLGLGFRNLSMSLSQMPLAREILSRVNMVQVHALAKDALECATATDVGRLIVQRLGTSLEEVWSENGIDPSSL
jgi:phosphotransferase system enzyme I (PtsI)